MDLGARPEVEWILLHCSSKWTFLTHLGVQQPQIFENEHNGNFSGTVESEVQQFQNSFGTKTVRKFPKRFIVSEENLAS